MEDERWYILGAGAMGCLWAGHLQRNGLACTLLVRPGKAAGAPVPRLTENGQCRPVPVPVQDSDCAGPIGRLLLTVKAGQALAAVESVQHQLSPDACLVLLQNGMGSQQQVAARWPRHAIYAGSSTQGACLEGRLHVRRSGAGITRLGAFNERAQHRGQAPVDALLRLEGLDVRFCPDIQGFLAEKLAINAAINGMTVVHDCPNGALLEPCYRDQLTALCQETAAILAAAGWHGPWTDGPSLLARVLDVLADTAANLSSSLQDVRRRRPSELRWINGWLLDQAARQGLPAARHQALIDSLTRLGAF